MALLKKNRTSDGTSLFLSKSNMVPLIILTILSYQPIAMAEALSITLPQYKKGLLKAPANDLIKNGKPIDRDEAFDLLRKGEDISLLNPQPNDQYLGKPITANEVPETLYPDSPSNNIPGGIPGDIVTVEFKNILGSPQQTDLEIFRTNVEGKDHNGVSKNYNLLWSLYAHSALINNALLRKLGYPLPQPKYFKKIKLHFANKEAKENFVTTFGNNMTAKIERWITDESKDGLTLTFKSLVMYPSRVSIDQYDWWLMEAKALQGKRALRSLIIPYAITDLGEILNRSAWYASQVIGEHAVINSYFADQFKEETTYEDAAWMLRKISQLTRRDFQEIVAAANYPSDISQMVVEKLISRRNSLLSTFRLQNLIPEPANLDITVGNVVKGKIAQNPYQADYAAMFMQGDPKSPLRKEEVFRYLKTEVFSKLIQKITEKMNKNLPNHGLEKVYRKFDDANTAKGPACLDEFRNYYDQHGTFPTGSCSLLSDQVKGATYGTSVFANRSVVTGTFYGLESKVQLVDQISGQASVGYFYTQDGIPNVLRGSGLSGNISVQRNYLHVKPIASLEALKNEKWKDLYVPNMMKHLGNSLSTNLPDDQIAKNLTKFIEDLKPEETFSITDTLVSNAGVSVAIPVTQLLELTLKQMTTLSVSGSVNYITVSKTQIRKTNDNTLQIYFNDLKSHGTSLEVNVHYFLNLLKLSGMQKAGDGHTRMYTLDDANYPDGDTYKRDFKKAKLVTQVIRQLLRSNDSEELEKNFQPHEVDHELKAKSSKNRFLFAHWDHLKETHLAKVRLPKDAEGRFTSKETERVIYSSREISRKGNNAFDFVGDLIDYFAKDHVAPRNGSSPGGDPSSSILGTSVTREIRSEGELTPGSDFMPVTFLTKAWRGWILKKKSLMKIFDEIETSLKGVTHGQPILNRTEFHDMKTLELYDITLNITVSPDGYKRLMEHIFPADGEKALYNRLIDLAGREFFTRRYNALRSSQGPRGDVVYGLEGEYIYALPWMKKIILERKAKPNCGDTLDCRKKTIEWDNRILEALFDNIPNDTLIDWIGKENMLYYVKVNGFRTHDENGDKKNYLSNTIGSFNTQLNLGIFNEISRATGITEYEMRARYFSEGF